MKNPQVDEHGTKRWFNEKGELHRDDDKPAAISLDVDKMWFKNGKLHRDRDKPAIEFVNGDKFWFQNGKRRRDGDKPAIERSNGDKAWFKNGDRIDTYHANFGCFEPKTRKEALQRLNAKERPHSRELYLADINRLFPLKENIK